MPSLPTFASGQWNYICDLCGRTQKSSQVKKTWEGYYVCPQHREIRNPQDFVRGVKDDQTTAWSRPEGPPQFRPIHYDLRFEDVVTLSEWVTFATTLRFPTFGPQPWINGAAVNMLPINGSAGSPPSPDALERVTFSESFYSVAKLGFSDTSTFGEAFSLSIASDRAINGRAINLSAINA